MSSVLDAYATMTKCTKQCINKQYKMAVATLDKKYKDKITLLNEKLIKKKISGKEYTKCLDIMMTSKLEEMKSIQEITKYYECAIQKCEKEVEHFKTTLTADLKQSIEKMKKRIKQTNDPNQIKIFKDILDSNKRRLQLVKTTLNVPHLIDLLYR